MRIPLKNLDEENRRTLVDGYGNGRVRLRQFLRDIILLGSLLGIGGVLIQVGALLNEEKVDHTSIQTLQATLDKHHDEFVSDQLGEPNRVYSDMTPIREAIDNLRVEVRDIEHRLQGGAQYQPAPRRPR